MLGSVGLSAQGLSVSSWVVRGLMTLGGRMQHSRRIVAVILLTLVSACSQDNGGGPDGSSATFRGSDLAANLKQGAVQQGYSADSVQAQCEDAPKRAGAISDCTLVLNGITTRVRVTYNDDQGHFSTETAG